MQKGIFYHAIHALLHGKRATIKNQKRIILTKKEVETKPTPK